MRIVHLVWSLTTGGIESMLADIASIQARDHDVSVFVINDVIDDNIVAAFSDRCHIRCFGRRPGSRNPIPLIRLNLALSKLRPDIIHGHMPDISKTVLVRLPMVYTSHRVIVNSDFGRYRAIYAISDAVRDYIENHGYKAKTVINGIDAAKIIAKDQFRTGNRLNIVQVGRLMHHEKGQHILIEALGYIKQHHAVADVHVDFIGEGPSRQLLEELVDKYNLTDSVSFLGLKPREYIYEHLRDYDLFCQPSLDEGFGLTVAEAMIARVPVLVSDLPGLTEVIADGRYGYSFRSGDAHELADRLLLISSNDNFDMIDQARQHAIDTFDIHNTALRYIDEYKRVLDP